MRRAHNRGVALNSEKNTYFLACDVDSNNYSFLNSTSIVTRHTHTHTRSDAPQHAGLSFAYRVLFFADENHDY